jgi:hypothetical protein
VNHQYTLERVYNLHTTSMVKLLATVALLGAACAQNISLPEVDLGYQIYRAASFNVRS